MGPGREIGWVSVNDHPLARLGLQGVVDYQTSDLAPVASELNRVSCVYGRWDHRLHHCTALLASVQVVGEWPNVSMVQR